MTKEFEQYLHDTRNEFVTAVNKLQWNTGFRTKCENLLIAYDQMKQALRKANVSGELPPHICKYCGVETNQPDEECYKAP